MTTFNLRTARLRPGEERRYRVAVELEPFGLGGERYAPEPSAPEAELGLTRVASGTMFELAFTARLHGPCVRCLAPAELSVRVRDRQYQAASPEGDETVVPYLEDDRLDLSRWAHDAVALEVPEKILCRSDCAGLCPGCGANLNVEACRCEPAGADPRWDKLAELRERLA
ncbi:MAG: DUF177 domain-containing protein [Gaiellales bacterium]